MLLQASTGPGSFDLYEQWSNSIRILWQAQAIQAIDTERLKYWPEINDLPKTGRLTPHSPPGDGDAPHRLLYVQPNGRIGPTPGRQISFMPYVHNTDSFGYDARAIEPGIPYDRDRLMHFGADFLAAALAGRGCQHRPTAAGCSRNF